VHNKVISVISECDRHHSERLPWSETPRIEIVQQLHVIYKYISHSNPALGEPSLDFIKEKQRIDVGLKFPL